jgi:GLPGLI family protein
MKNKINIIFTLFTIFSCFAQQSGRVVYEIKSIDLEIKDNPNATEAVETVRSVIEIAKNQTFTLEFNASQSKFTMNESMNSDENKNFKFYTTLAKISHTSVDYYLNKKEKILIQKQTSGELLEYKNFEIDWQITKETKNIDGYLCYKAINEIKETNRNKQVITTEYVAWFAPSLPFSFGPKNFSGLPGLILEMKVNNTTFLATKINLQEKEIKIEFPKGNRIDYNEYVKEITSKNWR